MSLNVSECKKYSRQYIVAQCSSINLGLTYLKDKHFSCTTDVGSFG